jgi:hypothetical protein
MTKTGTRTRNTRYKRFAAIVFALLLAGCTTAKVVFTSIPMGFGLFRSPIVLQFRLAAPGYAGGTNPFGHSSCRRALTTAYGKTLI